MALDITAIREHFPALKRPAIFLDNPGGTQIVQQGINRMNAYLVEHNANFHGVFRTSRETPLENSGQSLRIMKALPAYWARWNIWNGRHL